MSWGEGVYKGIWLNILYDLRGIQYLTVSDLTVLEVPLNFIYIGSMLIHSDIVFSTNPLMVLEKAFTYYACII